MSAITNMPAKPAKFVPLSEPVISGNEWTYVKECLDTGWVSSVGAFVDRFEKATAEYAGAGHAVAVVNGTAAIHVALLVCGVVDGDEVIVSDLTFAAPVNAIRYVNAFPVFMDARLDTWQMDADKLEKFLRSECDRTATGCVNRRSGRRVKAIVPVHILGLSCEIDRIVALAREFGLAVIEDATEAVGVRYNGRHLGTFGDVGTFSFNGNKVITTGGGGMVITDDAALAARARYLTTQAKDDPLEYVHHAIGYNYRLTNVLAAIGVAQLEQLDGFIRRKREIAAMYDAALVRFPAVGRMTRPDNLATNYWLYTFLLPAGTGLDARKAVVKAMNQRGIGVRPLWHTIHDLPPFMQYQAFEVVHSVDLYHRAISLPSGAGLSDDDVALTIDALSAALGSGL